MPAYRCLNCPQRPEFSSLDALTEHWGQTHTVPMVETVLDPWGERPPKRKQHYEIVPDPVTTA